MIHIQVKRSARRRRSVQLRAVGPDSVEISIPARYTPNDLAEVLSRHIKFLLKAKEVSSSIVPGYITSHSKINLWGKVYTVHISPQNTIHIDIKTRPKEIHISAPEPRILRKTWYSRSSLLLLSHLAERVPYWAKRMGRLKYTQIRVKLVRSLWGSCSHSGKLTFNKRLIHYPKDVVDYVIVHELAHLVYRHHGPTFWKLVEKYCKNYDELRQVLKQNTYG